MPRRKIATRYRGWVTDQLKPLLPRGWDLIPYTRVVDAITVPTVMVKLQTITRLPEAPMSSHITAYTVTIVNPAADPGEADASLDDDISELLHALDEIRNEAGLPTLRWTRAERVAFSDTYLAFDITVEVITTATPTEEQ
jgi:hypothetical protein